MAKFITKDGISAQYAHAEKITREDMALQLRAIREEAGLTQRQLSRRTGVTEAIISKLENAAGGYALPRLETVVRLMAALEREVTFSFRRAYTHTEEDRITTFTLLREAGNVSLNPNIYQKGDKHLGIKG